jgi:4-amino-4-deoxy-L-arabinose transferase-like glycosyltransferase
MLLCWAAFFSGLGRPAIGDSDEAFYAEAAREMVISGDWLTPHYNFEYRFQKPILFYWLTAGAYRVLGIDEAAARVWSAAAGLGLALLTAACGRRWYDEPTARIGGAIVATAFGYFSIARLSLPDLPLAFFITATTWTALVGLLDRPPRARRWLVAAGVACGLGFLTKGPLAIVIPAIVAVPLWWREARRQPLPWRDLALAAAVAAAIAVPWFLAMTRVHGVEYLSGFFVGDNVERFATTRFNDPRPVWFYLPIVAGGLLPWTPLAVAAIRPAADWIRRRQSIGTNTIRLIVWAVLPLLFFTASIGKQPRYVLPILPPLALLIARAVRLQLARDPRARLLRGAVLTVGVFLIVLGVLLYRAAPLVLMVSPVLVSGGAAIIAVTGIVLSIVAFIGRSARLPLAVALAGAATLVSLQYGLSPAGRDPVQDMAAIVARHRTDGEPIATYRVFVRNLVFYTGVQQDDLSSGAEVIAYLSRPGRVLCVISADDLARIDLPGNITTRTLGEVLYLNVSAVKLRTLTAPDPKRDLDRVLLVTNR